MDRRRAEGRQRFRTILTNAFIRMLEHSGHFGNCWHRRAAEGHEIVQRIKEMGVISRCSDQCSQGFVGLPGEKQSTCPARQPDVFGSMAVQNIERRQGGSPNFQESEARGKVAMGSARKTLRLRYRIRCRWTD